jgi:hypothetical protein
MVVAVSGEWLICRAPGGFEFKVRLDDVKWNRAESWGSGESEHHPISMRLSAPTHELPKLLS